MARQQTFTFTKEVDVDVAGCVSAYTAVHNPTGIAGTALLLHSPLGGYVWKFHRTGKPEAKRVKHATVEQLNAARAYFMVDCIFAEN